MPLKVTSLTAYFIQLEIWGMKAYVLQTRVRYDSHTSENLSELLKCEVAGYDLKLYGHMPSLTTNNAKK